MPHTFTATHELPYWRQVALEVLGGQLPYGLYGFHSADDWESAAQAALDNDDGTELLTMLSDEEGFEAYQDARARGLSEWTDYRSWSAAA